MSFANDLFSALSGFRDHLVELGSPLVKAVEDDLGRLEPAISSDIHQAEAIAKTLLHGWYASAAPQPEAPAEQAAPAAPEPAPAAPAAEPAVPAAAPAAEPAPEAPAT